MEEEVQIMSLDSVASEKQEKALKVEANKMAQLKKCTEIASSTPEGIIAFRQLMCMCGYNKSAVCGNPQSGDINLNSTLYNAARENLWNEFRQLIPVKARKKIEYEKTVYLEESI